MKPPRDPAEALARGSAGARTCWTALEAAGQQLASLVADPADDPLCAPPDLGGLVEPPTEPDPMAEILARLAAAPDGAAIPAQARPPRPSPLPIEPSPSRAEVPTQPVGRRERRHDTLLDREAPAREGQHAAAEKSPAQSRTVNDTRAASDAPDIKPATSLRPAALAAPAAARQVMSAHDPAHRSAVARVLAGEPAVAMPAGAGAKTAAEPADQLATPALAAAAMQLDRALARIEGESRPAHGDDPREVPKARRRHLPAYANDARQATASMPTGTATPSVDQASGLRPSPNRRSPELDIDASTGIRRLLARSGAAVSVGSPDRPGEETADAAGTPSVLLPEHAPRRDPRGWHDDPPPAAEADPESLARAVTDLLRREARRSGIDVGGGT